MGAAVGTKAVAGLGFVVYLQARGFVIMEGTVQHGVGTCPGLCSGSRFQVVVVQHLR
ncbi:hypothetical protein C900_00571 [Fulvivirga imtechensis AK7]|uniref:Uncharacterized protein n=1 Tax=Fulvivirga imtechensis AK7 TaxID=1237149 RepID=L8JHL0_9BACT|nr:hypothetical protein C900_00571 [Fulvivirga imtechensis AK7]